LIAFNYKIKEMKTMAKSLLILSSLLISCCLGLGDKYEERSRLMGKSRTELLAILKQLDGDIQQHKKEADRRVEIKEIQKLAHDLIDNAYHELDADIRKQELKIAILLNEKPQEQIEFLMKEKKTKAEAMDCLNRALKEENVKKQEELVDQAEAKVYWLETSKTFVKGEKESQLRKKSMQKKTVKKTGLKKKMTDVRKQTKSKKRHLLKDNQATKEEALRIANKLVKEAQTETDPILKKNLLKSAYELINNPSEALPVYNRKEERRKSIRDEVTVLMKEIDNLDSQSKRMELLDQLGKFERHPLREVQRVRDQEYAKQYKKAKQMAVELLELAKHDANLGTQEVKMQAAKKLLKYPLTTLKTMGIKKTEDEYLTHVPSQCKAPVQSVFQQNLTNLQEFDFNRIDEKAWTRFHSNPGVVALAQLQTSSFNDKPNYDVKTLIMNHQHFDDFLTDAFAGFLEKITKNTGHLNV
jgi:hypothetical protein